MEMGKERGSCWAMERELLGDGERELLGDGETELMGDGERRWREGADGRGGRWS
jgi:hypothetical protein